MAFRYTCEVPYGEDLDPEYKELVRGVAIEHGFQVESVTRSPTVIHVKLLAQGDDVKVYRANAAGLDQQLERAIQRRASAASPQSFVINNYGQAGAIGPNASASHNTFQQIAGDRNADLVEQIEKLQAAVRKSDVSDSDLEAVVQAKVEAKAGRFQKALEHLYRVGKPVLEQAETLGLKLLVDLMRRKVGLPPSA